MQQPSKNYISRQLAKLSSQLADQGFTLDEFEREQLRKRLESGYRTAAKSGRDDWQPAYEEAIQQMAIKLVENRAAGLDRVVFKSKDEDARDRWVGTFDRRPSTSNIREKVRRLGPAFNICPLWPFC